MKSRFLSVSVLCALVVLTQLAARAQSGSNVIQVNGCAANLGSREQAWTDMFGAAEAQPAMPPNLVIDFQNVSAKPVKSIEWGLVRDGSVIAMARDTGMFDPNATIMHAYAIPYGVLHDNTSGTCVPLRVIYADGSTWTNPNMPVKHGQ